MEKIILILIGLILIALIILCFLNLKINNNYKNNKLIIDKIFKLIKSKKMVDYVPPPSDNKLPELKQEFKDNDEKGAFVKIGRAHV